MSCACPRRYLSRTEFGVWHDAFDAVKCFPGAVRVHLPGCTKGAGLVGDEYETAASHQEGRDGVDEAMSIDYANIKKAKDGQ